MKKIFEDSLSIVFADDSKRIVITRNEYNNSKNPMYNVWIKESGKKGKTIATRCTIDTAMNFIK